MKNKSNIKTSFKDFLSEGKLNEISSDTIKSAINISKERGTDRRTYKLGELYFNKFIGKDLIGGKIVSIGISSPSQSNYRNVIIEVLINDEDNKDKNVYIYYDIDKDIYDLDKEIERKDAFILSKIASHINPDTKYKQTGKYFTIKGW